MADEKDKSKSLVKYEPKPLALIDRLEKKKRELQEALRRGDVADPITAAIATITVSQWILAGASLAISILTPLVAGALTPRQKIFEERGRRTGDLVINSELGVLMTEVYFGAGDDGYGGSWVPAMVGWTSGIRKHESTTTTAGGGGKFGGRGSTTETRQISYDLDWLLIWANKGPYRVLRSKANADVIFDLYGAVSSYEGEAASSYTEPYEIVAYEHASGGNEVTLQNDAGGNGGIVEWTAVQSNGAVTRQLSIYYRTSSGSVAIELTINGGTPDAITLPGTNEVYLSHTVPVDLDDGVNIVTIQNKSTTLNIGIDKIYCFPGHSATAGTGILDPTIDPDDPYDPLTPPNPATEYTRPITRWDGMPDVEPTGGDTGVMNHGGNAQFAIYPGNTTQLTDPTYEAAIDAQHGAGSTPAYRGRCYEVDSGFFLSRWGGMVPNRTALLEHETIKTKAQFDAFMCSRVGMDAADYNFSALETLKPRGLRIMGSRFEAREPMQAAEIPFDVVYAEQEGVLIGKQKFPFTSVATLTDKDFGWNDDEEASDGPLTLIDVIEPDETDLPRRVDVKYIDLDRDGEPGLQGYGRQVTVGEDSATLDLQWTLTREEAQALAQKEVYRRHLEKPCRYFLSWEHLWINVGDVFTASLSDGFTYTILHTKDSGGLGVRQCEGTLLDEPLFDQSAVADPYGYEQPVVPLPAMTVMSLLDTPLLREGDITNNDGVGWYVVGTPRTGIAQAWQGFALLMFKNGEWLPKASSDLPGTVGTVVSVIDLYPDPDALDIVFTADSGTDVLTSVDNLLADGDEVTVSNTGGGLPAPLLVATSYFVRDKSGDTFKLAATSGGAAIDITTNGTGTNSINVGKIVVDLYGTTQTLSSVAKEDMLTGANLALVGSMIFNFATATQVAGFPNRWTLTTLLTGQKETDEHTAGVAAGDRFVLLNEAVKFVPMEIQDRDTEYDYKAVTVGQSLDDAATIPAVWTGNGLRDRKPTNLSGVRDGSFDWFIEADGHPKISDLPANYVARIRRVSDSLIMRDIPISTGINLAMTFPDTTGPSVVDKNNFSTTGASGLVQGVRSAQQITGPGQFVEFTLSPLILTEDNSPPSMVLNNIIYLMIDSSSNPDWTSFAGTPGVYQLVFHTDLNYKWFVSAHDVNSGAPGTIGNLLDKSQSITDASNTTPIVITSVDHGLTTQQNVAISGVTGNTNANGPHDITVIDEDTYSLNGSVGNGAYAGGGTALWQNFSLGEGPVAIRIVFVGTEVRFYKNWVPGRKPFAISRVPNVDLFPFKMKAFSYGTAGWLGTTVHKRLLNCVIGTSDEPQTIYSIEQQETDLLEAGESAGTAALGLPTVDVEMWQVGRITSLPGFSVRAIFP